jgi:hypothetical protein
MKAVVSAVRDEEGNLIALMVAAAEPGDLPELMRSSGRITSVDLGGRTFTLETKEGVTQQFAVGPRTRYKSRDGSVNDLADLEPGMLAIVVAVVREDEAPMALLVGAAKPPEPPHRFTVFGEITNVIPGQQTFDLKARSGELLTYSVVERTVFRSRDGSIKDIHDLKKGMHAVVVGIEDNEGSLIALVVAVVDLEDLRNSSQMNDRSSTIDTRDQGILNSSVGDSAVSEIGDEDIGR